MIEVREGGLWRPAEGLPARIRETDSVLLRGFSPGARVRLGPVDLTSDGAGVVAVRLADHEELDCHIGMLVVDSPEWRGEVEITPAKITQDAFHVLRADLESTWAGLVLEEGAPTSLRARGPDALTLWRRVGPAVDAIRREPLRRLEAAVGYLRLERVRHVGELTPAVLVAGQKGLAARTRMLSAVTAVPEHAFVADTLRRLVALARRQPNATNVVDGALRWLRESPLNVSGAPRTVGPLHSIRHDRRFRLVQQVRRALDHPTAVVTEGPGELRLGVAGMNRLYEYWVFLQVLRIAARELGPPEEPGFEVLARRLVGGRLRLELQPGTTIRFPGGWLVAFEPRITRNPMISWEHLEYVPHPHPDYQRTFITPDVCVLGPGDPPCLYVIDAKYRGRHQIDSALATTHACYCRVRHRGRGIVEEVVVAHPHASLSLRWAGHRAAAFCPGNAPPVLPWFRLTGSATTQVSAAVQQTEEPIPHPKAPVAPSSPTVPLAVSKSDLAHVEAQGVVIVIDQTWTREYLGERRIDLGKLVRKLAGGRSFDARLIAPDHPGLERFFVAIARAGIKVERTTLSRGHQLERLRGICAAAEGAEIYVVSDRLDFTEAAGGMPGVKVVRDL